LSSTATVALPTAFGIFAAGTVWRRMSALMKPSGVPSAAKTREVWPRSIGLRVSSEGALLATPMTHATAAAPAMPAAVRTSPSSRKMTRLGRVRPLALRRWRSRRDMRGSPRVEQGSPSRRGALRR
jgi:hypothetical protein